MSRKKTIWLIILLVAAGAAWYGYREYTRSNQDYQDVKPDFSVSAAGLIREYEADEVAAGHKYNGRAIEISGNIRSIDKDEKGFYTIILGDSVSLSSARCSMDTIHKDDAAGLMPGSPVTLRGACTGFYKDEMGLGSDVILNFCAVVTKKD
ncbi:MAG: hypothetical protein WDO16_08380 [Bacteroidota bacterium]